MNSAEKADDNVVFVIGSIGFLAALLIVFSETFAVLRQHPNVEVELTEGTPENQEIVVTELADFWVVLSFFLTAMCLICELYELIHIWNSPHVVRDIAGLAYPFTTVGFLVTFFSKPLKNDANYKRFLLRYFIVYTIVPQCIPCISNYRQGLYIDSIFNVLRFPIYVIAYKLGLKLRRKSAKLSRSQLSTFLVHGVFAEFIACSTTIIFFTFEVFSCWIEEERGNCARSSSAALYLSAFVVFHSLVTLSSKAVSSEVRNQVALRKERIATLNLNMKETLQMAFTVSMSICGIILFSSLGVPGKGTAVDSLAGQIGTFLVSAVFILEAMTILKTDDTRESSLASRSGLELRGNLDQALSYSSRQFSSKNLTETSTFASFI